VGATAAEQKLQQTTCKLFVCHRFAATFDVYVTLLIHIIMQIIILSLCSGLAGAGLGAAGTALSAAGTALKVLSLYFYQLLISIKCPIRTSFKSPVSPDSFPLFLFHLKTIRWPLIYTLKPFRKKLQIRTDILTLRSFSAMVVDPVIRYGSLAVPNLAMHCRTQRRLWLFGLGHSADLVVRHGHCAESLTTAQKITQTSFNNLPNP
jgi:hypothetical protein